MQLKFYLFYVFSIISLGVYSQEKRVGINTQIPEASSVLEIVSSDKGVLLPRIALTATNSNLPIGSSITESLLVYNTASSGSGVNAVFPGFYYWSGSRWIRIADDKPDTYIGKFIISGTGNITISDIPFPPTAVKFQAYGNVNGSVNGYNVNADNGVGNNNSSIANSYNYMTGYATQYGSIEQQVISGGGSGNSINDISRYASDQECIGIRYANQNGDPLGYTRARVTSFNPDGFTLNVTNFGTRTIIIYTAHR